MMYHSSYKTCFLISCCAFALLSHTALAQTNSGAAPLLPPPPAEALQPIDAPATASDTKKPANSTTPPTTTTSAPAPAETPSSNLGSAAAGKSIDASKPSETAALASGTPGSSTASAPSAQPDAAPAPTGTTPVLTTSAPVAQIPSTGPIALPGMPGTEAGLNSTPANAATTTIDPSLVGVGPSVNSYDQVAYEAQLKQRLADIKVETRERAFENAKETMFPMKPEEIQGIIRQLRQTQEAIQKPIDLPVPTPTAVVHTMELDPGAVPPTINLLNGNVTSLSILDATGMPWPIVDIAYGGPFDVKPPEANGHIIRISPLKEYARGNMSIRLQKLATPITFTLESGGKEVHYRFDARIPQLGPNAKAPLIAGGISIAAGGDADLSAILVGTPPPSAERLKVSGVDGRTTAYRINGSTYVRTPLTLLSPSWQSSSSSADGTNVYVLSDAPVLLLSDNGTMVRAQLQQPVIDPFGLPEDRKAVPTSGLTQNTAGERG